jgi:uncharacterized protein YjbI with pentapeptide repeats
MKEKRSFLIGAILGLLFGWTMGYVRMPFINKDFSFGMGFMACFALLLLVLMGLFVWKKNTRIVSFLKTKSNLGDTQNFSGANSLVWLIITVVIVLGASISAGLIYRQSAFLQRENQLQKELFTEQAQVLEASRSANLTALMHQVFDKIDQELEQSPSRSLSEETIDRLVALNYSFKPRKYWTGDSLSVEKLSPERGQLLVLMSALNMDTLSFEAIKHQVSFQGADLRKADMNGIKLGGIDLRNADLSESNLNGVDFQKANLKETKLWGAKMNQANLSEAILNNADLKWAELNESILKKTILNGADIRDAKLRNVVADSCDLGWSKVNGAILDGASLIGADLTGTELGRANLVDVNFTGANLKLCNFSEANLKSANMIQVDMAKATTDIEDWFDKLEQWQVEGVEEIRAKYEIKKDVAGQYNFRLSPKED